MLEKLQAVEDKYRELESLLTDPATMQDVARWQRYNKEHAQLEPVVTAYRRYSEVTRTLAEDKALFEESLDSEMRQLVEQEVADLTAEQAALAQRIPVLLLPRDPNDEKNVIVEIRGGVGGDAAALCG